jgi:hypothetical protein
MIVRPYISNRINEFAFEICQKQGWFSKYKSFTEMTELDKELPYFVNAFDIASFSYSYWKDLFD